jgi:Na+-transporting methylmalonyl-CoA/oxaloacetate decarboxylase gamma subunit
MHFEHLGWGLQITVLGMGLVFGLLAVLWGLLTLVLRFDRVPAAPDAARSAAATSREGVEGGAQPAVGSAPEPALEPALVAAIGAALRCHLGAGARGQSGATPEERVHWPGSLLHASRWVAAGRSRQTRHWQRRR